jgi:phage repressor protein C with HTH and peptisase S24 domain
VTGIGDTFGKMVEERLQALKTSAFAVETQAGLPQDAIRNVIRSEKKSGPTLTRVEEICDALGLELYIGPRRDDAAAERRDNTEVDIGGACDDFELIDRYDLNVSAGPGLIPVDENAVGKVAFTRKWLAREGIDARKAGIVRVSGDSMAPTIPDGAFVLVHMPERELVRQGIFALSYDGQAMIKRLVPSEHGRDGRPLAIVLVSDNPMHPPRVVAGHDLRLVRVVGRVRLVLSSI